MNIFRFRKSVWSIRHELESHKINVASFILQEKFEALSRDHYNRVHELEAQVAKFKADAEETTKRIRQLEQTNDDLERANR